MSGYDFFYSQRFKRIISGAEALCLGFSANKTVIGGQNMIKVKLTKISF
jgi:hypothetical protein